MLLNACAQNTGDSEQARQVLTHFFSELSNGNYPKAAHFYGAVMKPWFHLTQIWMQMITPPYGRMAAR